MQLYNSLSRKLEEFKPLNPRHVGMYSCGPTVYLFQHIGNFRSFTTSDILFRTLKLNNYSVNFIMNITDVGHLTSDADSGEDKLEKSAKKEGKTAWEVAEFYTEAFLEDYDELHITRPQKFTKATDHIKEQIDLIKQLEEKGYTYQTSDGIYFDTAMFPSYGELSDLDEIKEGARVEVNPEKRNARDFALWKFSYVNGRSFDPKVDSKEEKRQMEWKSPWGVGFPGWHIECSAMSMKYLGETFDIHTGGVDHKSIHHPDEIAQSEAATDKTFANYWIHTAFMQVNGEKMSKSKGNFYRLYDIKKEGFSAMALRYLYLQTHYRQEMNFTYPALEAAQNALNHLGDEVLKLEPGEDINEDYFTQFKEVLSQDLNTPQALAIVWDMLKSEIPSGEKLITLFKMDEILGFNLKEYYEKVGKKLSEPIPKEVLQMVEERNRLRKDRHFTAADHMRNRITKMGYDIQDVGERTEIKKLLD